MSVSDENIRIDWTNKLIIIRSDNLIRGHVRLRYKI